VELLLAVQLVGGKVQVPVGRQRQRVGPQHPRVVDQRLVLPVCAAPQDGVVLVIGQVDTALVVRLQPVRREPAVPEVLYRLSYLGVTQLFVQEGGGRDVLQEFQGGSEPARWSFRYVARNCSAMIYLRDRCRLGGPFHPGDRRRRTRWALG
jgi:hypothetical protein